MNNDYKYASPYQLEYRRHMIVCAGIRGVADYDMWNYLMGNFQP